jgi:acetolactate synthase I/II/III large subunit
VKVQLHKALALALIEHSVDTMFGLIGDANLFFAHSFAEQPQTRFVDAVHEAGAVLMAFGYAAKSQKLGVATITRGPGLTNTATALVEAVKARTALLVICGDTDHRSRGNPQDIPQRDLVVSIGAGFEQLRTPKTALTDLAIAIRRAHVEHRPIVFDVAPEAMWEDIPYMKSRPTIAKPSSQPDDESIDKALGIIASCKRPLLVAGRGAAGAKSELVKLAERIGAPLATSLGGKDLFCGEDFDLGIMGTFSDEAATETILESDCLLVFGAGLNPFTTASRSLTDNKAIIHCDIDARRIGQHTRVDAALVGDTATVADKLGKWLSSADLAPSAFRSPALAQRLRNRSVTKATPTVSPAGTLELREALGVIDDAVPANRIFATDAGRFIGVAWTDVHVEDPTSFIFPVNFGSIGTGLAAGIGAACAGGDKPLLVVCGDGGFMLGGLAEFNSAVRHGTDMICVICNDGAYGAELIQLQDRGLPDELARFAWPDFAPLAEALGGRGISVHDSGDLVHMRAAIASRDRPLLIDVKLDADHIPRVGH